MTELEQETAHLEELRAKHRKNIRTLEEMLANYGMERPLPLLNELEFEREQLRQVEERLRGLAAQVEIVEASTAPAKSKETKRKKKPVVRGGLPTWGWGAIALIVVLITGGAILSAIHKAEMVYVPAGEFIMGSGEGESDEQPVHTIYLDAFYIDKTEVTNVQYRECVEAGECTQPHNKEWYNDSSHTKHPVVWVDWYQANDYCRWAGKRLPTEAEWEKAARGTDGRVYPWGNTLDGSKLNLCDKNCLLFWKDASIDDGYMDTAPVGSYPAGASPYGALDMAGNASEWVANWYDPDYYGQSPTRNPLGPDSGEERVLRGGSWGDELGSVRNTDRFGLRPDETGNCVGFRCAKDSP